MPSDPHDELARRRAERHHNRRAPGGGAADDRSGSADQAAAIARARESWFLSRAGRDEADEGTPSGSD
jgi:hypothetical protein